MKALLEIWRLLDGAQRRRFAWLQLVALVMALSTLVGIAALMPFLLVLASPDVISKQPQLAAVYELLGFTSQHAFLLALGVAFVASVLLGSMINLFGSLAMTRFALGIGDRFHEALLGEYLQRDLEFHAGHGAAGLFNKVVYSVNRVASGLMESAMLFVTNALVITFIVASALLVNFWAALIASLWIGGAYLAVYALARRRLYLNGSEESRLIAARARFANESLAAIRDVQVRGRQAHFREGFAAACRAISRLVSTNQAIAQGPRHALESITVIGLVAAALVVSRDRNVVSWMAELAFLGFAAFRLLPAMQQLFASVVRIRANQAIFDEVAADLAAALRRPVSREARSTSPLAFGRVPRLELHLSGVGFQYAGSATSALSAVDLRIPAGALVALIGANGSGKSTLMEIVAGLRAPTSGSVRVDGIELTDANRAAWQCSLSYAPQDPVVLDTSLAGNIAFGIPEAEWDQKRLLSAVRHAHLANLVAELPGGLAALVGEGGQRLSGGQRQRLGIARALYQDATMLLLDEPTSSLDGLTERELLEMLRGMRGCCTIIMVAHRPALLRECDLVIELERGRLVAVRENTSGSAPLHAEVANPSGQSGIAQSPP